MEEAAGFKVLDFNDLVIDDDGKAGIPFDILKKKFGFKISVKGNEVFVKPETLVVAAVDDNPEMVKELTAVDDFEKDSKVLKKYFGFKEYYQGSLIYSSENRGIKRYDVIISAADDWYNVTFKGDYEISCDINEKKNIIPQLIKFYFPLNYEEIIQVILGEDTCRKTFDSRDTLIRNYEVDTKEMVFSKIEGKL